VCEDLFCSEQDYMKMCFPCWKESRNYTHTKSDTALKHTQKALTELAEQNEALNEKVLSLQAALHSAQKPRTVQATGLTLEQIKSLIKLCHPDRHMGATRLLADKMTKWLLDQRESAR
jgi:uncharacterized protein YigA (DUF484 family)